MILDPVVKQIPRGPDEWLYVPVLNNRRAGYFVGQVEAREINGRPVSIRYPMVWCGGPGLSSRVWLESGAEGRILLAESSRLSIQDDQYGIALLGWTKQENRMCAIFDHRDIFGMALRIKVWRRGFKWLTRTTCNIRIGIERDGLPAARRIVLTELDQC